MRTFVIDYVWRVERLADAESLEEALEIAARPDEVEAAEMLADYSEISGRPLTDEEE